MIDYTWGMGKTMWYTEVVRLGVSTEKDALELPVIVNGR